MERRDSTYKSAARSAGNPAESGNFDMSTASQKLHAIWDTRSCTVQPGHPLSCDQTESSTPRHSASSASRSASMAFSAELVIVVHLSDQWGCLIGPSELSLYDWITYIRYA